MDAQTLYSLLERHTQRFLLLMKEEGWYAYWNVHRPTHRMPSEWDINNGWCDKWAHGARELVRDGQVVWLDDLDPKNQYNHAVLLLDGRYYDAQCLEGVENHEDLPLCREVTRTQWMRQRAKERKHE